MFTPSQVSLIHCELMISVHDILSTLSWSSVLSSGPTFAFCVIAQAGMSITWPTMADNIIFIRYLFNACFPALSHSWRGFWYWPIIVSAGLQVQTCLFGGLCLATIILLLLWTLMLFGKICSSPFSHLQDPFGGGEVCVHGAGCLGQRRKIED